MALFSTMRRVEVEECVCGCGMVDLAFASSKETTREHSDWFTLV